MLVPLQFFEVDLPPVSAAKIKLVDAVIPDAAKVLASPQRIHMASCRYHPAEATAHCMLECCRAEARCCGAADPDAACARMRLRSSRARSTSALTWR